MFDISNKTALITGCKRGIGKAIAIAMAQSGVHVIAHSATLTEEDDVVKKVRATGVKCSPYACDFSDRDSIYRFIEKIKSDHGTPDIIVNNAGTIMRKPAAEHPDEYWDKVLNVNLDAQFILSREFGRDMIARESGKIIFIASLLTFQGGITVPGYAASKGAIGQLTKALANEWAGSNVQVNAIAPGYIATDNTQQLQDDPKRSADILNRIPAGRWGKPEDLAGAAVFLASPASDYISGHVLTVDGGWMGR